MPIKAMVRHGQAPKRDGEAYNAMKRYGKVRQSKGIVGYARKRKGIATLHSSVRSKGMAQNANVWQWQDKAGYGEGTAQPI